MKSWARRRRYRLLDLDQLCFRVRASTVEDLRQHLSVSLEEAIGEDKMRRVPYWTESLAVGSSGFVEKVQMLILSRPETDLEQVTDNVWALSETPVPYGRK
jgi:hypothetical protein